MLLDTADDDHLLAVLPSDRRVELNELGANSAASRVWPVRRRSARLFRDCELGAIPPVGYGITTIVDDTLEQQPDVYFEAGDHDSLVHMKHDEFSRLMRGARHGQFSDPR